MVIKKCEHCNKEFKVFPYRNKTARFCSFSCNGKVQRKGAVLTDEHKEALAKGRDKFVYTDEIKAKMSEIKKEQYNNGIKPWNKDKTDVYSEETKQSMGSNKGMFGENSHNWKGGLNPMWVRKERLRKNGGSHTKLEWEELKEKYNHTCPCCKEKKTLTKDHIIPVTEEGTDNIENIQPLCRNCNSQKHKLVIKFEY